MKKTNLFKVLILIIGMPIPVFAQALTQEEVPELIFLQLMFTIFAIVGYLYPLVKKRHPEEKIKYLLLYLGIRFILLLIGDFLNASFTIVVDFFGLFIGVFLTSLPMTFNTIKKNIPTLENQQQPLGIKSLKCPKCEKEYSMGNKFCTFCQTPLIENNSLKCLNCKEIIKSTDNFCQSCGKKIVKIQVTDPSTPITEAKIDSNLFDATDKILEKLISLELQKINFSTTDKIKTIEKRKFSITVIFSILMFLFMILIFFHFPIYVYLIGLLILLIYIYNLQKYTVIKYLKKEIKARPNDKITNIISSLTNDKVPSNKIKHILPIVIAIILPLLLFIKPIILYEKTDEGYYVRFYSIGLTNMTTATIPEKYKGQKVIGLRGNTFSNIFTLREVSLPDTIKVIRGQTFKNDINLTKVTLPNKLEYLGGGAFYNCSSLTTIDLPETLKELNGETFMNCSSLTKIKLPTKIPEIRGNTFEGCSALTRIEIPEGVTRIGGHAFYGCSSLSNVTIPTTVTEIGSSAFRQCTSLYTITIPESATVNTRAFKESPTTINYYESYPNNKNYYNYSNKDYNNYQ